MKKPDVLRLLIAKTIVGLFTVTPTLAAPHYTVTDLGLGQATAMNDRGDVVGVVNRRRRDDPDRPYGTAFLWKHGRRFMLPTLGGPQAGVYSINNRVEAVGESDTTHIVPNTPSGKGHRVHHAVLWRNERAEDLHPKPDLAVNQPASSAAVAINNRGMALIVVNSDASIFLWRSRKAKPFIGSASHPFHSEEQNFDGVEPVAINDEGTVEVHVFESGSTNSRIYTRKGPRFLKPEVSSHLFYEPVVYGLDRHGNAVGEMTRFGPCLWPAGHTRALLLPTKQGFDSAKANAINDQQAIVGTEEKVVGEFNSSFPLKRKRAMLWKGGRVYDLNRLTRAHPGWILEEATAINTRGQIVGYGRLHHQRHAFLLTPVPTGGKA